MPNWKTNRKQKQKKTQPTEQTTFKVNQKTSQNFPSPSSNQQPNWSTTDFGGTMLTQSLSCPNNIWNTFASSPYPAVPSFCYYIDLSQYQEKMFLPGTTGVLYSFSAHKKLGDKRPEHFQYWQWSSVGSRLTSVMTYGSRAFLVYRIRSIFLNCCGDHTTSCTSCQASGRLWIIQERQFSLQAFSLSEWTKQAKMASTGINRTPSRWKKLLFYDRHYSIIPSKC